MIKISGRHVSVPKELKRTLKLYLPSDAKIVMNDICSCRHRYRVGFLKIVSEQDLGIRLRGYYGSGIVNFFIKFPSIDSKISACSKIKHDFV